MLWVKAFHIIFIISWFAGLFYLPRIFVNHAMESHPQAIDRLTLMEQKLYRFMHPLAFLAIGSGIWLWKGYGINGGWMHAKLTLILVLIAYHVYCGVLMRRFKSGNNTHSHTWYRWFNEIPVLGLVAIVILVVVKPF